MSDLGNWDEEFDNVPVQSPLDALPAGPYALEVIESEMTMITHKDGTQGRRVSVTYQVIEGAHDNRKSWDRFDIDRVANTRNGPAQIDRQRFKTLVSALGMTDWPRDTAEMHGIVFQATAKVEQSDDPKYPPKNVWGSYKPAGNTVPQRAAPPPVNRPAPAAKQATPASATSGRGLPPAFMNRQNAAAR